MKFEKLLMGFAILILLVGSLHFVAAQQVRGSATFVNRASSTDLQRLYSADINTYWPALKDPDSCFARQDMILQIPPGGCQPSVVRSDLLAEQNVPVFCQIDALQINPLVDVNQIRNIRFSGNLSSEVVGTGFHPARAALRSRDKLLGSPLINNIGYVVVVLKQNPVEDDLPELIKLNLNAQVDYEAGNAFGIGKAEFLLNEQTDEQWKVDRHRQSFWQGRYFVRVDEVDPEYVVVSIFNGENKFSSIQVKAGETSSDIFVPGLYCQAGLKVAYDGAITAKTTAKIKVDEDIIEVVKGTNFLNGKCVVRDIKVGKHGEGTVDVRCGSERLVLGLENKNVTIGDLVWLLDDDGVTVGNEKWEVFNVTDTYDLAKFDNEVVLDRIYDVDLNHLRPDSEEKLFELNYDAETEKYFGDAITTLEHVADDYPLEKEANVAEVLTFGELALERGIALSNEFSKQRTEARLINKFLDLYPNSDKAGQYGRDINELYRRDTSLAGQAINLDNGVVVISLLELSRPNERASAEFTWSRNPIKVNLEGTAEISSIGKISLDRIINVNEVRITAVCNDEKKTKRSYTVRAGTPAENICDNVLKLEKVDAKQLAKIRLLPNVKGTRTETNLTVGIGIEKRAIELNPNKAKKKIDNLGESIEKWESISEKLGKVVKGMKAACFATSATLVVKNFVTGLDGTAFARQNVMRGHWNNQCKELVSQGTYDSVDACYLKESAAINRDVREVKNVFDSVNNKLEQIEAPYKKPVEGLGGVFGETIVDRSKVADDFVSNAILQNERYSSFEVDQGLTVNDVLLEASYEKGDYSYDQAREIMFNVDIINSGASEGVKESARNNLKDIGRTVQNNKKFSSKVEEEKRVTGTGMPELTSVSANNQRRTITQVSSRETLTVNVPFSEDGEVTHVARVAAPGSGDFETGVYVLGLVEGGEGNYLVKEVLYKDGNNYIPEAEVNKFADKYGVGNIKATDQLSLVNRYENPEIRYYETEPYKGMPAIVPFNSREGWYAATKQTLPAFGGIGSFESSGRVASFWLCNVGENGRAQFFEGIGDDICQQINLNTGQPLNKFPGLSDDKARQLIRTGIQALQDAARQHGSGKSVINVAGEIVRVGSPAANVPGTQCQDFMSPQDCAILFNVCDPVICPSSRCDLGGSYPVADVIQSGIVGSALLCLPNFVGFGGDVAVPVCLTGVQAGVDGYLSILKSHQACLQENIETGRTVGICDQITSVYMCEFFWRQTSPISSIIVPKLFEVATGQTTPRGGGEYMTVKGAWDNAQNSVDFFTQHYAVNSLEAFRIRSVEEAGTTFCRAFVSAKSPTALESLIEPDSPPQFHAWFSSTRFTDATVPATAQYKVFYHIFAGKDQGVSYRVYLKDPPQTSFYQTTPSVQIATGFVPRGEFGTETIDLTAPEGYKQLCVRINNKEECGFKQVSTNFAINYLRDEFVSDEITRTDIISEKECISGGTNAAALLTPNIQEAVEETLIPQAYERGIVRICSTQNPGSSTDPTRFVSVGNCGDQRITCWLDKGSVENALTENNVGVRDETLSELENTQLQSLRESGEILPNDQTNILIKDLKNRLGSIGVNKEKASELIAIADATFKKAFFNHHKAQLNWIKGEIFAEVAAALRAPIKMVRPPTQEDIEQDNIVEENEIEIVEDVQDEIDQPLSAEEYAGRFSFTTSPDGELLMVYGGQYIGVAFESGRKIGKLEGQTVMLLDNSFNPLVDGSYTIIEVEESNRNKCVNGLFVLGSLDGAKIDYKIDGSSSLSNPMLIDGKFEC